MYTYDAYGVITTFDIYTSTLPLYPPARCIFRVPAAGWFIVIFLYVFAGGTDNCAPDMELICGTQFALPFGDIVAATVISIFLTDFFRVNIGKFTESGVS